MSERGTEMERREQSPGAGPGPPVLEVRDLQVRFDTDWGTICAVNGASYGVAAGETLAIVGESGSGKTVSTLACLGLIPRPPGRIVGGEVRFSGQNLLDFGEDQLRRVRGSGIAMVFQDPMTFLNPVLTIERQMTEGMELHLRLHRSEAKERAVEYLARVGIPNPRAQLDAYPHQLSGGMRQRVMIAMALSCEPSVLIADEPTTALDVTIQAQILELVRDLKRELGMGIIWITHDLAVVASLADRVAVMYAGRVVEEADVKTLFAGPEHPYTLGLLQATPRTDWHRTGKLLSIPGAPPNLARLPEGCPFHPRCPYREERCTFHDPPLTERQGGHSAACWVDVRSGPRPP